MPRITENKGPTVYKNRQELIFRNEPKMYQNVPKCTYRAYFHLKWFVMGPN